MSAFKKHKKSYAILLVNLLLLVIGIVLYHKTEQVLRTDNEERLLTKINLHIDSVLISIKDAQRGERGYVISGNKAYLEAFYNARKRLNGLIGYLETALNAQKDIQKRFVTSERWMANALSKFDEIIKTREEEGAVLETLAKKDYEGKLFIDTLQNTIHAIEKYEKEKLDNDAQKALASLQEIVIILMLSGGVIVVMVVLLSGTLVRDILKREELTLKLEGSEKRYHFLFELSADGIVVTDLNGIITDCNTAACNIFGYSKQELVGKSYHIIWPDEQKHLLPAKISRDTVTGDRLIERTYVKKDGTILNAEVYTKLIEINGLSNVVAHIRDITDKKQAQKAIAKSEEKYRNLFERSLSGIFRTTIDGQIIECNDEYARVLGYNNADDIKNISTKNIYADPTDREKLVILLRNEGEVKDLVMKLRKKNGSYAWVYDSVSMMFDEDLKKEVLFGTMVDITAQKDAELLLTESEKKFKDLVELLPQTVFEFDLSAKVTFANKAGYEAFGYSQEDFEKGLNAFQLIIPEDKERAKRNIEAALKGIKQINNGYTAVRKDGSTFPMLIYSSALIKENKPLGVRGIMVDISELKQSEELLRQSENRFRSLIEKSPVAIAISRNSKYEYVNDKFLEVFGYSNFSEVKDLSIIETIAPAYKKFVVERNMRRESGMDEIKAYEAYGLRKDGSIFPFQLYVERIGLNNGTATIAFITDITERKKAEEKINMLAHSLESISECVSITNENNIILFVNDSFAKTYGYKREELIGQHISVVQPSSATSQNIQNEILDFTNSGGWKGEILNKRRDGTDFPVYLSTSVVKDLENKPMALVGVATDITERKLAEEALRLSEEKFNKAFQSSPIAMSIQNNENLFVDVNNAFLKLTGFSREEVIGYRGYDLQLWADKNESKHAKERFVTDGVISDFEYRFRKKSGEIGIGIMSAESIVLDGKPASLSAVLDITERKHAEEALRQQEALLRVVLETLPIGVWVINGNGTIEFGNQAGKEIWAGARFVGIEQYGEYKGWWADSGKQIGADEWAAARAIKNGVTSLNEEINIECFDGTRKTILNSGVPIRDADQRIKGAIIVNQDITERKHAEEEIYRLNRIYTVLSNINKTIVRVKEKKQLLNSACRIAIEDGKFKMSWIGLIDEQSGELKVVGSHGFVNGYFDEVILNKKKYPNNVKPISELIATGKFLIFNDIEKLDANEFWRQQALNRGYKSNAVFPLIVFGKVIGNYSLFSDQVGFFEEKEIRLLEEMSEDISFALETMEIEKKRKESESLFHTLAKISPVGIFRTRADGYTTYVNPKWCQLSGMKAGDALGDGWLSAVHPEDRNKLSEGWREATEEKRQSVSEYRFIHADGSVSWVMGQAIPELNAKGEIEGYVGTITDITNIKLYEHELIKAKETAENSERIKSEFLAQMSHEIRTPINVIVSSTSYLKDELEDKIEPELFTMFNSLDRAGKRIIRTVDLILNMAEIQTNSYHCTPMHLDISGRLLVSVYNEFISSAKEKNLEFNLHRKIADAKVYVDEYSVRQMFCQLIDNAIKYTNEGKVDLTVDKDAEGKVFVSIADTGIGMTEEFMSQMYNPFTQEEQGYSRSFEGNGLGLALVKKYCEINNATITVESAKGKGSVFTIKF